MLNEQSVGKYFIIRDISFSNFMKNEEGNIDLYDTFEEAALVCGMYEFPNVLICKVEYNHIER